MKKTLTSTGIAALDHALGSGFLASGRYLIDAHFGVGRSTLGLQSMPGGMRMAERWQYDPFSEPHAGVGAASRSCGCLLKPLKCVGGKSR